MGIADRKAKEKEELKALILGSAKKLFAEKGIEETTIRSIAKEIDYSVGTVYVYYKDKTEILHDLHQQGFTQLGSEMRALFYVSDPMERLKALGRIYMKFALENTQMYDLMFNMKAPMEFIKANEENHWKEGNDTFGALRKTVKECIDHGYFKGHQLEPLSFVIWGSVHGMCSLYIRERVKAATGQEPDELMNSAYEDLMLMLSRK
ncbi:TetR/AcrR family transcriptional regulator [Belliella sp. DSM 107340]|uniref:TetR/AcrR family transcriptional regulator n=1 Tax=Belliella calami TaxID=2923436 RepID=A0ABS9UKJ2_9BACT|nr:TetR/AcrR family transcriptional regulator [Belliella calami]MCH7396758.1 TetR/AcrR family transcriptional regulator [Belliella calami]